MSKKNTRKVILDKALEAFNDKGIEYVGLRELAGMLDIRVSNITYYFPTKDDLVNQLAVELNKSNSQVMVAHGQLTIDSFLQTLEKVFQNQVKYRCLLLSIVHIMAHNKVISVRHKQTQKERNEVLRRNLITLRSEGFLQLQTEQDADHLASTISLISRFWISEAAISYKNNKIHQQLNHYLGLIAHLLLPYSSKESEGVLKSYILN